MTEEKKDRDRPILGVRISVQEVKQYLISNFKVMHKKMPILCFLQNMGLKETQEFPSPEQFVRNNYGKWNKNLL